MIIHIHSMQKYTMLVEINFLTIFMFNATFIFYLYLLLAPIL